jgi:hypothetical protein
VTYLVELWLWLCDLTFVSLARVVYLHDHLLCAVKTWRVHKRLGVWLARHVTWLVYTKDTTRETSLRQVAHKRGAHKRLGVWLACHVTWLVHAWIPVVTVQYCMWTVTCLVDMRLTSMCHFSFRTWCADNTFKVAHDFLIMGWLQSVGSLKL